VNKNLSTHFTDEPGSPGSPTSRPQKAKTGLSGGARYRRNRKQNLTTVYLR
jgi:hypothetical protein